MKFEDLIERESKKIPYNVTHPYIPIMHVIDKKYKNETPDCSNSKIYSEMFQTSFSNRWRAHCDRVRVRKRVKC